MIKYFNKFNGMVYWVEDGVVLCDDPDMSDPMQSSFSLVEFYEAVEFNAEFKEI